MSNARTLADLMGTSTTIPSSKLSLGVSDLPAGSVIQVVQGVSAASHFRPDTLDTYQDIGLSVTITPTSSSNKVLIMVSCSMTVNNTAHTRTRLLRGSTNIKDFDQYFSGADWQGSGTNITYLDSPATTSATTYKIQGYQDSGTVSYSAIWKYNGKVAHIIAMEIAG